MHRRRRWPNIKPTEIAVCSARLSTGLIPACICSCKSWVFFVTGWSVLNRIPEFYGLLPWQRLPDTLQVTTGHEMRSGFTLQLRSPSSRRSLALVRRCVDAAATFWMLDRHRASCAVILVIVAEDTSSYITQRTCLISDPLSARHHVP